MGDATLKKALMLYMVDGTDEDLDKMIEVETADIECLHYSQLTFKGKPVVRATPFGMVKELAMSHKAIKLMPIAARGSIIGLIGVCPACNKIYYRLV